MRETGIFVERTRKCKATTDSDDTFNIAPNLLEHDFTADQPNQKWAGDISYTWTREGWLYLAVILDLYSRRVIGWAVSDRMKRDLAIRALKMAMRHKYATGPGGPTALSAPKIVIIAVSIVTAQLLQRRVHDRWSDFQAI